jgi:hypothetical protein
MARFVDGRFDLADYEVLKSDQQRAFEKQNAALNDLLTGRRDRFAEPDVSMSSAQSTVSITASIFEPFERKGIKADLGRRKGGSRSKMTEEGTQRQRLWLRAYQKLQQEQLQSRHTPFSQRALAHEIAERVPGSPIESIRTWLKRRKHHLKSLKPVIRSGDFDQLL